MPAIIGPANSLIAFSEATASGKLLSLLLLAIPSVITMSESTKIPIAKIIENKEIKEHENGQDKIMNHINNSVAVNYANDTGSL